MKSIQREAIVVGDLNAKSHLWVSLLTMKGGSLAELVVELWSEQGEV